MAEEQTQKQEPVKEAPQQKKELPQKKQQPEVVPKPENCMKCNKHLQRKVWYYRSNGYYCSKRCWKLAVKAAAEKQEKAKKET